jgi:hypothetical protein
MAHEKLQAVLYEHLYRNEASTEQKYAWLDLLKKVEFSTIRSFPCPSCHMRGDLFNLEQLGNFGNAERMRCENCEIEFQYVDD